MARPAELADRMYDIGGRRETMRASIGASVVSRFSELFIDERSHFYKRPVGNAHFFHEDRWLEDADIRDHLEGRCWVATTRAEATKILGVDLDAKQGPDPEGAMLRRYELILKLMPEPLVFRSSSSRGLHCYWHLEEEVLEERATTMLRHYFMEHEIGVGRGTCEFRPTIGQSMRLPLGAESALLDPHSLLVHEAGREDPAAAIEFIMKNLRRHGCRELQGRIDQNRRQRSIRLRPPVTATMIPESAESPPRADVPSSQPKSDAHSTAGLSQNEMAVLLHVTSPLAGRDRYRQLQFLFDLVTAYKTANTHELELPKRTLVKMTAIHSGSYARRLALAETSGLIVCVNPRRSRRHPRRYRLTMHFESPGTVTSLAAGLRGRDLTFLSKHLQAQIENCTARGDHREVYPEEARAA
jgi:hypothetical protein